MRGIVSKRDYLEDARNDARDMVEDFLDEIVEQLLGTGKASDDYNNDYPGGDAYHHENHWDKSFDLLEAAELLDQCSDHEETDNGLWEGIPPREAISAQAAFTYGNTVSHYWSEYLREINDDDEIATILNDAREDEMAEDNVGKLVASRIKELIGL